MAVLRHPKLPDARALPGRVSGIEKHAAGRSAGRAILVKFDKGKIKILARTSRERHERLPCDSRMKGYAINHCHSTSLILGRRLLHACRRRVDPYPAADRIGDVRPAFHPRRTRRLDSGNPPAAPTVLVAGSVHGALAASMQTRRLVAFFYKRGGGAASYKEKQVVRASPLLFACASLPVALIIRRASPS